MYNECCLAKSLICLRGHSKSTFAQKGGLTKSEQKRTGGGGGGGFHHCVRSLFKKIVWPILFTLAIVIELFSSLLLPSCKQLLFFVWWLGFVYTFIYQLFWREGGGGVKINKCIYIRLRSFIPKSSQVASKFSNCCINGRKMIVGRETGIFSFFSTTAVRAKIPQI